MSRFLYFLPIFCYNEIMDFTYKADYNYFVRLLAKGDRHLFEKKYKYLFDFRDPKIKRKEFNFIRKKVFSDLVKRYGLVCRLKLHPDCSKIKKFDVDHIIPLSTNELNKKLRNMKPQLGKKVSTQSFGSNHPYNLTLACSRCNAFKKHKILTIPKIKI